MTSVPSPSSFLDYTDLQLVEDEPYIELYYRMLLHAEHHTLQQGDLVEGIPLPYSETLTHSHRNLIALNWLQKLGANVVNIVKLEKQSDLQQGHQLHSLVHDIADHLDSWRRKQQGVKEEEEIVVKVEHPEFPEVIIKGELVDQKEEDDTTEGFTKPLESNTIRKRKRNDREDVYPCDQCDYKGSRYGIYFHKKSKHKGTRFPCDQCNYSAIILSHLKKHIDSKHNGVRYSCDQCEYEATQPSHLKRHKESKHEGLVRYLCDQCEYATSQLSNLKTHEKARHGVNVGTLSEKRVSLRVEDHSINQPNS